MIGRVGDLSDYNALPSNPGNADPMYWRVTEQAKGRLGAMSHLLVQGMNKIPLGMAECSPVASARG